MDYNQKMDLVQKTKLFVGVDIGKKRHGLSLKDQNGKEIGRPQMIDHTKHGLNLMLDMLDAYDKNETLIGMEPTGHYWKPTANFLKEKGYKPVLVNSYHVNRTKEVVYNSKTKTDIKDSKVISQMIKEGKFLEIIMPEGIYAELRELSKTRNMIIKEQTSAKIRLRALFDEFMPEYDDCFKDIASKTSLTLLKTFGLVKLKSKKLGSSPIKMYLIFYYIKIG